MRFDLRHRTKFPVLFAIGCLAVIGLTYLFNPPDRTPVALGLLTGFGGVMGFLYSRHSQDLALFRELFKEFNERFDRLNEKLNAIRDQPPGTPLTKPDIQTLYNYFNLCAEEHMYHLAGCIDARVWFAWRRGMKSFADDPEIRTLWEEELRGDAYYGFSLDFDRDRH